MCDFNTHQAGVDQSSANQRRQLFVAVMFYQYKIRVLICPVAEELSRDEGQELSVLIACEQRGLRRVCSNAHTRHSLHCSYTHRGDEDVQTDYCLGI